MKLYVNCAAEKSGCGSKEQPFKYVNEAAKAAMPGDEVIVAPGIYREYVDPVHAGTEECAGGNAYSAWFHDESGHICGSGAWSDLNR